MAYFYHGFKATLQAVLLFIFSSALSNSLIEKTSVTCDSFKGRVALTLLK